MSRGVGGPLPSDRAARARSGGKPADDGCATPKLLLAAVEAVRLRTWSTCCRPDRRVGRRAVHRRCGRRVTARVRRVRDRSTTPDGRAGDASPRRPIQTCKDRPRRLRAKARCRPVAGGPARSNPAVENSVRRQLGLRVRDDVDVARARADHQARPGGGDHRRRLAAAVIVRRRPAVSYEPPRRARPCSTIKSIAVSHAPRRYDRHARPTRLEWALNLLSSRKTADLVVPEPRRRGDGVGVLGVLRQHPQRARPDVSRRRTASAAATARGTGPGRRRGRPGDARR